MIELLSPGTLGSQTQPPRRRRPDIEFARQHRLHGAAHAHEPRCHAMSVAHEAHRRVADLRVVRRDVDEVAGRRQLGAAGEAEPVHLCDERRRHVPHLEPAVDDVAGPPAVRRRSPRAGVRSDPARGRSPPRSTGPRHGSRRAWTGRDASVRERGEELPRAHSTARCAWGRFSVNRRTAGRGSSTMTRGSATAGSVRLGYAIFTGRPSPERNMHRLPPFRRRA